jgi:EAL domain-containing protein (putative c-di-GMP-specific phosphodiesterase class I)
MTRTEPAARAERRGAPPITMAFQPIVNVNARSVFGYEALVRGVDQAPAAAVLSRIDDVNRDAFDRRCRERAIELAGMLGVDGMLDINFMAEAAQHPEAGAAAALEAASASGLTPDRLIFEVTQGEQVADAAPLKALFAEYRRHGFTTAIDDFGAGRTGLGLLAELQPDLVKLDMALTRGVERDRVRRAIVASVVRLCDELAIRVVAEGIETPIECLALQDEGIALFQGYLFARPAFEQLPEVADEVWPQVARRRVADRRRPR